MAPDYVRDLQALVERATPLLGTLSDSETVARPGPERWSPREIIGHLIDSASNNHQRFVRAQFSDDLVFPGYDQEGWVAVQRYHDAPWSSLVALWSAFNLHLAWVMSAVPDETRMRPRVSHNLHELAWRAVPNDRPTTLDYFMSDYVGHLRHHLRQILGPDFG